MNIMLTILQVIKIALHGKHKVITRKSSEAFVISEHVRSRRKRFRKHRSQTWNQSTCFTGSIWSRPADGSVVVFVQHRFCVFNNNFKLISRGIKTILLFFSLLVRDDDEDRRRKFHSLPAKAKQKKKDTPPCSLYIRIPVKMINRL